MAKELINSTQIQEFLQDFESTAKIEILEEGKEQNEIFEIAQARGINLKESPDLAGFKCVYCFADIANKNKARLPKKALLKALPTLVGKPVDIDHLRNRVVGVLIDSRYIVKDESVVAYGILFKANFPEDWETAEKKFKSGKLKVSYEIWCPQDKRTHNEDGTYSLEEQIIAGMAILFDEEPAFTNAKVLELAKDTNISKELVFASYKCEDIIVNGKIECQKCGKCKHEEIPSKADELKIDNSAIKEEAKGEVIMEEKKVEPVVEVASTPDAKSEVAEVKPVVAEAVAPVVAKEEEKKTEEVAKIEETKPVIEEAKVEETIAPKTEEVKIEVAKVEEVPVPAPEVAPIVEAKVEVPAEVKVEAPILEEAKTVIETHQTKVIEDVVVDKEAKEVTHVVIESTVSKVTETQKIEEPVSVAPVAVAKVEEAPKVEEPKKEEVAKIEEPKVEEAKVEEVAKVEPTPEVAKECEECKKSKLAIASLETKVEFYKVNALEIAKRRKELGDAGKTLTDEELIDNAKFSDAKLEQANLETSSIVGTKKTDEDRIKKYRDEITAKAEGRIKRVR